MALGYKVALTNVWWNRGGQDTRLFQDTTEQQTYFSNLGLYYNELNNFNINDNITTAIIFKDKSGRDAETLLKCNYAIVWNTIKNTYRYYFITDIKQDSCNQMQVALELDDIQTNVVGKLNKIKNIYVKQWTGANVVENSGTYELIPSEENILNTGDNPPKFNQSTQDIFLKYTENDTIDEWLNNNIACWRYIFLVANQTLIAPIISDTSSLDLIISTFMTKIGNSVPLMPYEVVSTPVYKTDKRIYIKYNYSGDRYGKLTEVGLDSLWSSGLTTTIGGKTYENGTKGTYGIAEKYSNIFPFDTSTNTTYFEVDSDGDLIITCNINLSNKYVNGHNGEFYYLGGNEKNQAVALTKEHANNMFVSGMYIRNTTIECEVDNPIKMIGLTESEAKETATKLMDVNYSSFKLRLASQSYTYNPLALIGDYTAKLYLEYTEVLQAGISKIYLRFKNDGAYDNYYTDENTKDYTGLVGSYDFSLPLLTNQWADYLANNKNYYLQTAFNNTIGLVQNTSNTMAFSRTTTQKALGSFSAGVSLASNIVNQQLERENMQQAPDGMANGNGDPYFNICVDGIKPKLDYLATSKWERKIALDKFKLEGTPKNKVYSSITQLVFAHHNYDVISCNLSYNSLGISNKEFERLINKFSGVLRFWYNDTLDFEAVNYLE